MAISTRDLKKGAPPVKRNIASLVGGFVIGAGCFVLWMLVVGQLTEGPVGWKLTALGAVFALAIGTWIRVADL